MFFKTKYDKKRITPEEFYKQLYEDTDEDDICDPPISYALEVLLNELIDDNWYIPISEGPSQVRTAMVATILKRHQSPLNRVLSKYFEIL